MSRIFNFSAGPATLPESVLVEAQQNLVDFHGCGHSIMEASHRGKEYDAVHEEAIANITELLGLPDDYAVLLLQGGATGQFAMLAMNFLAKGKTADYTNSGAWAKKAISEARAVGSVNVVADTSTDIPTRVPDPDALELTDDAAYLHVTSNETISGAQWKRFPKPEAPLIADMSSDILSAPLDVSPFGMIYAGAQKNLGPSGVTLVIMRKDLAERCPEGVPPIYQYKNHLAANSLLNTPPTFGIYILSLVTRWLKEQGGLPAIQEINERKAGKLYAAIDASGFYSGTAVPEHRSTMNVTYRLPSEELEAAFIKQATAGGLKGLKGHRSVGGVRASIYNAFPESGVDVLIDFMKSFEQSNG
jgi:phosphoserine aminotransferase